ncbi:unnamed protein product [Prunus armeniaca]|uniref:Uncharacterized protein n=1 Tax=Prunus armeniaca TaxID=36596 RepID=A0A6J5WGH3_PRUAR|nr:unnamed protein product [Prunus armeniaca]CAB4298454.1 unnamed protein product [Prunus armeniaca]
MPRDFSILRIEVLWRRIRLQNWKFSKVGVLDLVEKEECFDAWLSVGRILSGHPHSLRDVVSFSSW